MINGHGGNINQICDKYGLSPGEIIDFSASINPLGYPAAVRSAITEHFNDIINYPDSECTVLRKTIAGKTGCSESNILIGNGSNELFYLIPRALRPKQGILLQPTFSEFKDAFRNAGIEVVELINENKDFSLVNTDLKKLKRVEEGMVFVCNPNNPTGRLAKREDILELVTENQNRVIVVDEAFMDFVDDEEKYSVLKEAHLHDNLIVVRSLTKFYGFPGLRIGYLVTSNIIHNILVQCKEPWTVNTFAQLAGIIAMNDTEFASHSRKYMSQEKVFFYDELMMIDGLRPFPPTVNFILVKIDVIGTTSSEIQRLLLKNKILIRDCANFVGLDKTYFRVAVKTREENRKLLSALKSVMNDIASEKTNRKDYVRQSADG